MSHTDLWIDQHDTEEVLRPAPEVFTVAEWMLEANVDETLFVADALEVIWLVQSNDEVQPVVWPLRIDHRHDQDCGRA